MEGYRLVNVNKQFLIRGKSIKVFNNLTFSIYSGEITVILGKSGCGKTTMLRLLGNLDQPTSGTIEFYKENKRIRPKIGMVFQESRLFPWFNVRENMTFFLKRKSRYLEEKYLKLMKLDDFGDAYPSQLSGGMAHRVAIGRALAFEPNILLMDEPFASLDFSTRSYMQKEIIRIYGETKKGIVFVTHNIDEAILIGHKIIILDNGKIANEYTINDIYPRDLSSPNMISLKNNILQKM